MNYLYLQVKQIVFIWPWLQPRVHQSHHVVPNESQTQWKSTTMEKWYAVCARNRSVVATFQFSFMTQILHAHLNVPNSKFKKRSHKIQNFKKDLKLVR